MEGYTHSGEAKKLRASPSGPFSAGIKEGGLLGQLAGGQLNAAINLYLQMEGVPMNSRGAQS